MVQSIKTVLINRDNISEAEADELIDNVKQQINEVIDTTCDLFEIEQIVANDLGLEPDYLDELLNDLM